MNTFIAFDVRFLTSHHEFIRHPFPKQPSRSVDINLACLQSQYFHGQARCLQTHGDIARQWSFWLLFGLTRILIPFEAALVATPGTTGHCGILQSITPEEVLKGWETLRAASAGNNTVGLGWDPRIPIFRTRWRVTMQYARTNVVKTFQHSSLLHWMGLHSLSLQVVPGLWNCWPMKMKEFLNMYLVESGAVHDILWTSPSAKSVLAISKEIAPNFARSMWCVEHVWNYFLFLWRGWFCAHGKTFSSIDTFWSKCSLKTAIRVWIRMTLLSTV